MRKLFIFLLLAVLAHIQTYGRSGATLTAEAPDVVVSGDQFRLTFTVNTQKVSDFRAPSIKGFEVLMGPSRSQQSSTQIINGKVSSSSSITYTYILMAGDAGKYTVPSASIEVDGQKIFSNALTIQVLPPDQSAGSSQRSQGGSAGNQPQGQMAGSRITANDLFITATASKTTVHEQEAVLLTYKVYTLVNLRQLLGDMPDLKGFHTQEVELSKQKKFTLEHYKGRNYNTTVWSQYILFPQQTGKLEIPSISFEAVVAQMTNSDDPFDAFFNGGGYVEVKKKIVTPKLTINVTPLPAKPADFSGGVGEFSLSSSINAQKVKTNDAVTLKLQVSGTGNMKLINAPEVKFPQDFEVYDPKTTNNFTVTRNGLAGTQTIEYLAIPRHAGNFTIPAIEFTYFDLKSNAYKTLHTQPYELNVEKGQGNADQVIADFTSKEDVKILGQDIRFIKMGNVKVLPKGDVLFGTATYWLWYILPFIIFVAVVMFFRKQIGQNANTTRVRTRKANKVAVRRLKLAGKLMRENKPNEFYDEVLKAMWGYTSDKLSIPVSMLSKDNIEAELLGHGVEESVVASFIRALDECEFARYAPGSANDAMDKVYTTSVDAISSMENSIKH